MASKTLWGKAGSFLIIAPVEFRSAFKIAGAVGIKTCSPRPFAPKGPSGSSFSINILCISCGKKDSPVYQAQTEYNKNII